MKVLGASLGAAENKSDSGCDARQLTCCPKIWSGSYHSVLLLDSFACGPRSLSTKLPWRLEDVGDIATPLSVTQCEV